MNLKLHHWGWSIAQLLLFVYYPTSGQTQKDETWSGLIDVSKQYCEEINKNARWYGRNVNKNEMNEWNTNVITQKN